MIEELLSASGIKNAASAAAAAAAEFADEEDDNDGWEDLPPNVLDLGLGTTKAELMAYGEGSGSFSKLYIQYTDRTITDSSSFSETTR